MFLIGLIKRRINARHSFWTQFQTCNELFEEQKLRFASLLIMFATLGFIAILRQDLLIFKVKLFDEFVEEKKSELNKKAYHNTIEVKTSLY